MSKAYFKWKELLVYEEDGKCLFFEAPMGAELIDVYVPTIDAWNNKAPAWARSKRANIMDVISNVSGLGRVIEEEHASIEGGEIGNEGT